MPPNKSDSTYNCCTSREPPSPDGLAPHPAISPIKLLQKTPNTPFRYSSASTSSVHIAEVRKAIFDSDKEGRPDANNNNRACGNPRVNLVLGGESAEDNHKKRPVKPRNSLSSLNLKAVAQKLKKRLSRDSALNKRNSRASIGTSEEEIERRAELRRIRQKRIQEELSDEGIYDADAKSLDSIAETPSAVGVEISGDIASPPVLKAPALSPPTLSFREPQSLERQEQCFSNYQVSKNPDSKLIPIDHVGSVRTTISSSGTASRRHSYPILSDFDLSFADPRIYVPLRKQSSVPKIPLTPKLEPQRLPSFAELTTSSWRLSFTSKNRAEHLRKLSRQHSEPSHSPIPYLQDASCPLSKWVFTPGLGSTGQQLMWTHESSLEADKLSVHSRQCTASESCRDSGDVDRPKEDSYAIPLHEMGISRQLASRGLQSSSSSPQLSSWGSHQRGASNTINISTIKRPQRLHDPTKTSDSIPLSERIPYSWGQIVQDDGLSLRSPTSNSSQPLPKDRYLRLLPPELTDKGISDIEVTCGILNQGYQQLPREIGERYLGSDANLLLPIPGGQAEESGLNLVLSSYARRSTIDNGSILAYETDSFREREAELLAVQARFASVDSVRVPSTPKSSRFHEEFHLESLSLKVEEEITSTQSGRSRSKNPSQSYDGENAMEDLLAVPLPDFEIQLTPKRSPGIAGLSDDMSELNAVWGQAFRLNSEARAGEVANDMLVPSGKSGPRDHISSKKSSAGGIFESLSWKKGRKSDAGEPENSASQYEKRFQEQQLAVKEVVMHDWEAEIATSARKAKAQSRNIVKKGKTPIGPDRRFPLSWSRYPSHSRDERCLSAGTSERVESHDFAASIDSAGQRGFHTCREVGDVHLHADDPDWHKHEGEIMGMKARLGDKISQKLYKIETHGGGSKTFEFQTDGRRGSMRTAAKLAFPELKVLPVRASSVGEEDIKFEEQNQTRLREERKLIMSRLAAYGDGSGSGKSKDAQGDKLLIADLRRSIADPRFYDDCVTGADNDDGNELTDASREVHDDETRTPIGKFKTWNGGQWHKYRPNRRGFSLGTMALGK